MCSLCIIINYFVCLAFIISFNTFTLHCMARIPELERRFAPRSLTVNQSLPL